MKDFVECINPILLLLILSFNGGEDGFACIAKTHQILKGQQPVKTIGYEYSYITFLAALRYISTDV